MIEKIKVVNKSNYELPKYAKAGDSGMDVKANISESIVLKPLERQRIPTGLYVELPKGLEIQIRPRSGLTLKEGLVAAFGTIDCGYRNEIGVTMFNLSNSDVIIEPGERIAQFVFAPVTTVDLVEVSEIDENTDRGLSGYGESGKF